MINTGSARPWPFVMIKGNVNGGTQINNWINQVIRILRVFAHLGHFCFGEWSLLVKNTVWNTHFSNIMHEHSAADVN